MSGGSSLPYGNIKNGFVLAVAPTGPTVGAASVYVSGTTGSIITLAVPGVQLGDFVDVTRPSNTVNGNTTLLIPYVGVGNAWVAAAGYVSVVLTNSSVAANVTTPLENYGVCVFRPDTPNAPTTTPSGFY